MHPDRWPTPTYSPTPADRRRAKQEAIRYRVGKVLLALLVLAILYAGC